MRSFRCVPLAFVLFSALVVPGLADEAALQIQIEELRHSVADQQSNSDHIWTMIAATLVLLMQAGFLLLEAGSVRAKNSINVAQKNVVDVLLSVAVFYLVGFGLMFGTSAGGWFGTDLFAFDMTSDWNFTFFVFQAVFVGTSATIMSGAVAERMKFSAYLVMSVVIALVIYPAFGHWAWGNLLNGDNPAYLGDRGFIDFAGSTVVHSVGAWIGLAGVLVLGPRLGKFNADGSANTIQGYSAPLAAAGGLLLLVGWFGFNGGSTTAGTPAFARIIANTLLAAVFGGVGGLMLGAALDKVFLPMRALNGMLGGLVAITAGCDAVGPHGAAIIGLLAGCLVVVSELFIERTLKLDDVIGAVSVHGICGVFGTIVLAVFALDEKLAAGSRLDQLLIQTEGAALAFVWSFGVSFAVLKGLDLLYGIRVSQEDEEQGLNIAEHGATLGTGEIQRQLLAMTQGQVCDLRTRFDENSGDEAAEIAQILNPFLGRLQNLIGNIASQADAVGARSEDLARLAGSVRDNVRHVDDVSRSNTDAAGSVRGKLDENSGLLSSMNREGQAVAAVAIDMASQMTAMAAAVEQVAEAVTRIGSEAEAADTVSREAAHFAEAAQDTVDTLKEATDQINEIVAFILDVSGRTNLLALNATIEAARAGDAGRGFAVVASEVKDLAVQTARAVEDIQQRVARVQTGSDEIFSGIAQLTQVVRTISLAVSNIRGVAGEQSVLAHRITGNVRAVVEHSNGVTERIRGLAGFIETVDGNSVEMTRMATSFEGGAGRLRSQVESGQRSAEVLGHSSRSLADVSGSLQKAVRTFAV
ncbi:ammonium transporter [Roseibium aestuarii]|uniref:Ammonium transporter n=1 Tax=Roseibium aestuarii TaxID=2600299 RepID=A0ABW4JU94_9HYPH|nr:ammonium transporter [Roseibium aestuarii]